MLLHIYIDKEGNGISFDKNTDENTDKDKDKDKGKDKDKDKVLKRLNMCFIFEKQKVEGW